MRVLLVGCLLSFKLLAQSGSVEELYQAGRANIDRYKSLLSRCDKSELRTLHKSLETDRANLNAFEIALSKTDASENKTLESCHKFIDWRFLSVVSHSYLSKLQSMAEDINNKRKYKPNCQKIMNELNSEQRYFYKVGHRKCSEFNTKPDYASIISEAKVYNDRLEQMLISCDRNEFIQTHPETIQPNEELFNKLNEILDKYEKTPIQNYDDCHQHKELELQVKSKVVLLEKIDSILSRMRHERKSYKINDLKHDCEMTLKLFLTEKDSFDSVRDQTCLKYKGK